MYIYNKIIIKTMNRFTFWSMEGKKVEKAKLHRVIDGDTYEIYLPVCCFEYIFKCRLAGIDTPELHPKTKLTPSEEEKLEISSEKEKAEQVKEYVKELLIKHPFNIKCGKFDKYGRVLCDIDLLLNDKLVSLASILIAKDYAKKYDK